MEKLIEENKEKVEKKLCIICLETEPNSVFYKCGHGGFCFGCAQNIIETHSNCHYCRQVI